MVGFFTRLRDSAAYEILAKTSTDFVIVDVEHVGELRHCQIQLEPAAATIVAAKQNAILLRRVHG